MVTVDIIIYFRLLIYLRSNYLFVKSITNTNITYKYKEFIIMFVTEMLKIHGNNNIGTKKTDGAEPQIYIFFNFQNGKYGRI